MTDTEKVRLLKQMIRCFWDLHEEAMASTYLTAIYSVLTFGGDDNADD